MAGLRSFSRQEPPAYRYCDSAPGGDCGKGMG